MEDNFFRRVKFEEALLEAGIATREAVASLLKRASDAGVPVLTMALNEGIVDEDGVEKLMLSVLGKRDTIEILVESGVLTPSQIEDIRFRHGGRLPKDLGDYLVSHGLATESDFARALALEFGAEYLDVSSHDVDDTLIRLVGIDVMQKYGFIPYRRIDNKLVVIVPDPRDIQLLDELEYATGFDIKIKVANPSEIKRLLNLVVETSLDSRIAFRDTDEVMEGPTPETAPEPSAGETADGVQKPVIKLVESLLLKAILKRASDVHFEPYEKEIKVKYRIDGVLFEVMKVEARYANLLVSRIKVMADLDIAEKRVPQDGRFSLKVDEREVDFRVSVLPSIHGETVVLRILDKTAVGLDVKNLGFRDEDMRVFLKNIRRPYGMILVAGPTGSGKTTTLYSAINEINTPEDKLITIEDPVEFQFDDIVQVAVNEKQGLTFAGGLRSIVRQDPDKVMVGEIRDVETAQIAINAALTGHLVLSSIHANNVMDCISRLINMGIDVYQFVSSFNLIISQRLVRKICLHCKEIDGESSGELRKLVEDWQGREEATLYRGAGCRYCHRTGYSGRSGIYEMMPMSGRIKQLLLERASPIRVMEAAVESGMTTLRQAGWLKVETGVTTIQEMNRVTFED